MYYTDVFTCSEHIGNYLGTTFFQPKITISIKKHKRNKNFGELKYKIKCYFHLVIRENSISDSEVGGGGTTCVKDLLKLLGEITLGLVPNPTKNPQQMSHS